jgi:hypothetical protein
MKVGRNVIDFLSKPGRRISSINWRNNMLTVQYNDLSIEMFHHNETWKKAPEGYELGEEGQKIMDEILKMCKEEVKSRKTAKI